MTRSDLAVAVLQFALNSVLASLTLDPGRDVEALKTEREAAAAMLADLNPRDAIQAAFAARAVIMHHAAAECFRRAALPGAPDAMVNRLMATGAALSRQSAQLIQAMKQCKGEPRPAAPIDPAALARAHVQAARAAQPQPVKPAPQTAFEAKNPMPSEKPPTQPGMTPPAPRPLTRAERRRAQKLAAKAARMRR